MFIKKDEMWKKVTRQIEGKIKKRLGIERPSEEERERNGLNKILGRERTDVNIRIK